MSACRAVDIIHPRRRRKQRLLSLSRCRHAPSSTGRRVDATTRHGNPAQVGNAVTAGGKGGRRSTFRVIANDRPDTLSDSLPNCRPEREQESRLLGNRGKSGIPDQVRDDASGWVPGQYRSGPDTSTVRGVGVSTSAGQRTGRSLRGRESDLPDADRSVGACGSLTQMVRAEAQRTRKCCACGSRTGPLMPVLGRVCPATFEHTSAPRREPFFCPDADGRSALRTHTDARVGAGQGREGQGRGEGELPSYRHVEASACRGVGVSRCRREPSAGSPPHRSSTTSLRA
ncbi:hypothetical protein SPHINGO8AM_120098 [Sphingomonas sp. 8AM]|nr:hypothetical protein SPHINGO8AM_120098 [Sphingomonas sp. 8AM]